MTSQCKRGHLLNSTAAATTTTDSEPSEQRSEYWLAKKWVSIINDHRKQYSVSSWEAVQRDNMVRSKSNSPYHRATENSKPRTHNSTTENTTTTGNNRRVVYKWDLVAMATHQAPFVLTWLSMYTWPLWAANCIGGQELTQFLVSQAIDYHYYYEYCWTLLKHYSSILLCMGLGRALGGKASKAINT